MKINVKKICVMTVMSLITTAAIVGSFAWNDWFTKKRHERLVEHATIKPVKVFQIGFSKCGTSTLSDFFNRNGILAVHHDYGHLAESIYQNAKDGMPLISPQYEEYAVFTDMERMYTYPPLQVGLTYFKELDKQYPGSKFILNTRDKQAWLKSRAKHPVGKQDKRTILEVNAKNFNISEAEVLAMWEREWDEHHKAVLEYFKDRPDDLLVFNIEEDSTEKLVAFFKDYFVLSPKIYKHRNKTSEREAKGDVQEEHVEIFSKTYKIDPEVRRKYKEQQAKALIKPVKVFQIGFSKCGTVTLASFFNDNAIASVHHDYGKLAMSMYHNWREGKPLIDEDYKDFWVYTDMERMYGIPPVNVGMLMFKELDKQYPGSKFILNTRNKEAWLKSRSLHPLSRQNKTTILEINMKNLNMTREQVLAMWAKEWDDHHKAVMEYFKDRPQDLIVFNIDTDPPEKLAEFLKDNFYLDTSKYEHRNKTTEREEEIAKLQAETKKKKGIFG